MISYKEKLSKVTTFIFDVDGVMTTGEVLLFKDEYVRVLNSKDGYALQYARKKGYRIFVITGGSSERLRERLLGLGVDEVCLSSKNKLAVYESLKKKYDFQDEEVAYMGDDIPDYEVLSVVGVSSCPQDSAIEIKALVDYQSPLNGGKACVRDLIEQVMRVQETWFTEGSLEWQSVKNTTKRSDVFERKRLSQ